MGLYFKNITNETLYLVYAYEKKNCEAKWAKKGWYTITPGQEIKVWSGWAGHYKFLYYAENKNVSKIWPDKNRNWKTFIPWEIFDMCWDLDYACSHPPCGNVGRYLEFGLINPDWGTMDQTIRLK
ncbi:hypothetical protein CN581_26950 [Bacillus toyonensis]|uniref:DUF1036 domain-containing protein n=1 Tax=Bacillus toyonensis TaxID=155322 RepID=UPI000BF9C87D|nr:DUF1036 domain-containing protein [Bacillus toyonensis]PEP75445.1 hypothetical protein CN581_26950 [Bacillus toyonensis]